MSSSNDFQGNEELIRRHLLKILAAQEFRNSQVLSRFLEFVVKEVLAGRAHEIKEYTIGVKALGRAADFNPQFDAVVRIHAGRLRRMLREYYNGNDFSDSLVIEIPKGSYVPSFKFLTIENVTTPEADNKNENRKPDQSRLYRKATVAVFPFHNFSADDSKNYFAEGLGEQLCIELAKFQHLSVISYYSTVALAPENDRGEWHKLLDLDYAIMGSTRFFDGLVQINVQLTRAETDAVLWSQTFVRQFGPEHSLILQEDVIQQVLYKIADPNGIITRDIANAPPSSKKNIFGVYDAVYLYFSFGGRYDAESFTKVRLAVETAVNRDPNNALLWALLSRLSLNNYIFNTFPDTQDLDKGRAFAEKALWLDQNCQYAYKALAWSHLLSGRTNDCHEAIEQCLDLNPNVPSILGSMGFLNICIGKYDQGFHLLLKTLSLQPVLPWYCNIGFALYYYRAAAYHEASEWARKAQPAEMPFISLVRLAMAQQLINSKKDSRKKQSLPLTVVEHAEDTFALFLHDRDLRDRLSRELKSSGVTPEQNT